MRSKQMQASVARGTACAVAVMVAVQAMSSLAYAGIGPAPEMDGGTLSAGLGLKSAGVLMLRARLSK